MDERLEIILVSKYPKIFRDYKGDPRHTCMAWGISCGDGWFKLLDDTCRKVTDLIGDKDIQVIADQVKEKLGGLRFYYSISLGKRPFFATTGFKIRRWVFNHKLGRQYRAIENFRKKFYKTTVEKIEDVISNAEIMSYKICETCGEPGKRRGGFWITVACDECDKKFEEGKKAWRNPEEFKSVYEMMFGKDK